MLYININAGYGKKPLLYGIRFDLPDAMP